MRFFSAGADSDNDSGIELSVKRSQTAVQSSIAPKLKKAVATSSLFSPRSSSATPDTSSATFSMTSLQTDTHVSCKNSLEDDLSLISAATSAEDSALLSDQPVRTAEGGHTVDPTPLRYVS